MDIWYHEAHILDALKFIYQQGREDAINEFLSHLLNDVDFVSLEDEIKIRNLYIGIAEQIKEQKNE